MTSDLYAIHLPSICIFMALVIIDNLRICHNASGMGAKIRVLVTYRSKRSIFTLKIFYLRYDSRAETCAKLKNGSLFCKTDYTKG